MTCQLSTKIILTTALIFCMNMSIAAPTSSQRIQQLERQLNTLNVKVNRLSNTNTTTDQHDKTPHRLFHLDGLNGSTYFEMENSSDRPRSILALRSQYPLHSLTLGGLLELEPISSWWGNPVTPNYHSGRQIGLSDASLDLMAINGEWIQAYLHAALINAGINSAFLTIGNLKRSPYYVSVGKFRPRFGQFPGALYATSTISGQFRPGHTMNLMAGFSNDRLNAYLVYQPDQQRGDNVIASLFLNSDNTQPLHVAGNIGAMSNVAASTSQLASAVYQDKRHIPAIDMDMSVGLQHFTLAGGWVTTLRKAPATHQGRASSWWSGLNYELPYHSKHINFAVNYSKAHNTQTVDMPLGGDINHGPTLKGVESAVFATLSTEWIKNLIVGAEYIRMKTYTKQHTQAINAYTAYYF